MTRRPIFLMSFMLTALTGMASAKDGATPVWRPMTIDRTGAYVLTRDICGPSTEPVITINPPIAETMTSTPGLSR